MPQSAILGAPSARCHCRIVQLGTYSIFKYSQDCKTGLVKIE